MPNRPVPSTLKRLRGNPGKRPLNENEPKPEGAIPPCPRELSKVAKREWRRISRELYALGLLTRLDRAALAAYCQGWSTWLTAIQKVRVHGLIVRSPSGYPMQSPYLAIANQAQKQFRAFMVELGMTPSARANLDPQAPAPADELEEFLSEPRSGREEGEE